MDVPRRMPVKQPMMVARAQGLQTERFQTGVHSLPHEAAPTCKKALQRENMHRLSFFSEGSPIPRLVHVESGHRVLYVVPVKLLHPSHFLLG